MVKVTNINGTTDNVCKCGSWLERWQRFGGQAILGFVLQQGVWSNQQLELMRRRLIRLTRIGTFYPLCRVHNGYKGQPLNISETVNLVSANVSRTC